MTAMTSLKIDHVDHLVLTVRDISVTCAFYETVLGMEVITFGINNDRKALLFGSQKINLHQAGKEFEPKAQHPTPGSADLCFITLTPIGDVVSHFQEHQIEIVEGPVQRTGALGAMESVYIRDPDLNLIEVSNYLTH